jgi:hypothetical protein
VLVSLNPQILRRLLEPTAGELPVEQHAIHTNSQSYWQFLPGNLSSNTFAWTPEFQEGSRNRPTTEGNETDFRPKYEEGDSV